MNEHALMRGEHNKQLALQFFVRFSARDIDGALQLLADDATWWIAGSPSLFASAGTYSKERVGRMFHRMNDASKQGIKMQVKGVTAESDRVALEVESYGELHNGRVYNNQYHTLMTIRDSKILEVREYLDTQLAHATWFQR